MAKATKLGQRQRLSSGPFNGVWNSRDPYDARSAFLVDAKNGYIADPQNGSGWYTRPGFLLGNNGVAVAPGSTCQAIYAHTNLDGTTVNFMVWSGRLFRVDNTVSSFTDVTPVGITIDPDVPRVYFASLIGTLMVTDGVNRPWIASDLTNSPITGTYIDYDGVGGSWSTVGAPKVYGGAAFVILNMVNGVSRRTDISWCNPGTLAIGWQQPDYDNNWTLAQNEAGVLYALESDNVALRYFRTNSIGAASGTVGPDLASTATDDALAFNIGSQSPDTIQKFGNGFFFCDALGRPWWYQPGIAPEPIWKAMRAAVDDAATNYPTITAQVAVGVIEPTTNLYIVAIWSPDPATQARPVEMHVFDAITRQYQGRWDVADGISIDAIGTFIDSTGRVTLIVGGSSEAGGESGYVWTFNAQGGTPLYLTTEDGRILTTEDGRYLTTEGQSDVWMDNGQIPDYLVTTDRLGYDEDINWFVDQGVIVTLNDAPVRVTVQTSAVANSLEGIPQPATSYDGTYRLPVGCEIVGRGPQVTVKPLTSEAQWVLERVSLQAVPAMAGPEDS